jgi:hypothetical protein
MFASVGVIDDWPAGVRTTTSRGPNGAWTKIVTFTVAMVPSLFTTGESTEAMPVPG